MKICVAQIRPVKGDIEKNIKQHVAFINKAVAKGASLIIFPELSLTGYEPELTKELATTIDDKRFDELQQISDNDKITIGAGMPLKTDSGILIGMILFQPGRPRTSYAKQHIHTDEVPYFVCGKDSLVLDVNEHKIAPAICYESLLPEHAEQAHNSGAEIYFASVAKSAGGVAKAQKHYPVIAAQYSMPVLMANCVGYCDNFDSVGTSSVWTNKGVLAGHLDDKSEGLLIFDTDTEAVTTEVIK
ncbi:MAG: acyltransferase [Flavipsychrobacter sp.]|nr:acyltransferase [Flavipsychrobacter sp.]